ncbi:MAG: hypothetical protein FJY85_25235, partial [Deltaproteobacteria bacterium]|nr:hypothetical protein [Deltaproteobacteria bacterium]
MTFLTEREAAEYLGVSLHTLRTMETEGTLIPFRTLDGHCGYSLGMLNEYLGKSYEPPHRRETESESKVPDVSLSPAPELQSHDSPLAAHLLFDEAEQEPLEPEAPTVEPLLPQSPSPPLDLTPLSDMTEHRKTILTVREAASGEYLGRNYSADEPRPKARFDTLSPDGIPTVANVSKAQVVDAPEPMDEPDTPLSDGTSTQADASPTQTADIPIIRIRVSSEDSIEVLGLSARSLNGLMHASIRTIGELLQAIESQILPWFAGGIGPKTMAEIEDSLARVWLVDAPEAALGPKAVAEESVTETESHAVEPLPPQPPSPPPDPTPADVLGLSIRPYNALRRSG